MIFDDANAGSGQTVLIHGAGGGVGAYAVQLAVQAGLRVIATSSASDIPYVQNLGAETVIDYRAYRFEEHVPMLDIVLDTVGGETMCRSLRVIKPGGILVSVVYDPETLRTKPKDIRAVFFLVDVTTARLDKIAALFDEGKLIPRVGMVLPLELVRTAHEMLAGSPHQPGKIILDVIRM